MVGDLITAFINDHQVAELQDTTYIEGTLSLIAGTPQGVNNYHAAFTQVTIEAPE